MVTEESRCIRVLLVEDSEADAILLQHSLQSEVTDTTYELIVAPTLREAKALLAEETIDVVLLDLSLPDSWGVETVKELKRVGESIPFIVLSGLDDNSAAFESIRAEAQDYLVKGESSDKQLRQTIAHAIERQKIQNTFRQALAVAADLIVIFDLQGEVLFTNQSLLDLHLDDFKTIFEAVRQGEHLSQELTLVNDSVVEARNVRLSWERRPAILCSLRDITARKRAARQLQELQARALESQRLESLGTLAGGVAHEFNNLLTGILGNSDLLAQDWIQLDEVSEIAREIRSCARAAAKLTQHLLGFARKGALLNQRVNLHDKLETTKEILAPVLSSNVQIELELLARNPIVECDPEQLNQVLLNLALNGQDAMKSGGLLSFKTFEDELGRLVVEVRDQGTGIPARIQPRIFDPFFTTKPQNEGTGMGLAMVWGIANQAGWQLDFETGENRGTCFRIAFPFLEAKSGSDSNGVVITIERDKTVSTVIKRFLHQLKFEVYQLSDLSELASFGQELDNKIDVVIADLETCQVSPDSILQAIRQNLPTASAILMTADSSAVPNADPDGFLFKPFDFRMLASTLHQSLVPQGHKAVSDLRSRI